MNSRVLMIAGGTGGHIFPALAVAEKLYEQGIKIFWLGSALGLEKTLVPERFPATFINAKRLRGKGWRAYVFAPGRLIWATWQAWRAIRAIKPDVVLAMGGFVSGPGGIAAKLSGIPLVIHEQNAISGYSNRLLAIFADHVLAAYPGAFRPSPKLTIIGNPVRAQISALPPPEQRLANRSGRLRLLILGGSQGARPLNQFMVKFLVDLARSDQLEIWHQTGQHDLQSMKDFYAQTPITAKIEGFITDMVAAYEWADLLLCRAGALTIAEITAVGITSILVPFPAAVDDHQWFNARFLQQAGAGILIRQADLNVQHLQQLIDNFLKDRASLIAIAKKSRELGQANAAEKAASVVLKTLEISDEDSK